MRTYRFCAVGAGAFGTAGMGAGLVWSWLDFPFVVGLEWAVGMAALGWLLGGGRLALRGGVVGAIVFPMTFLVAIFFAIADGSPIQLGGAAAFGIGAAVAGAIVGASVAGMRGALAVGAGAGIGYWSGALLGAMPDASVAAQTPGMEQALQFALGSLIRGAVAGTFVGAAFAWLASGRSKVAQRPR